MIKKIVLKNIRNAENLTISFNKNFTYIKGPNGIGKTTILESINLVSTSKSHRTKNDVELIRNGEDFGIIYLETTKDKFRIVISQKGKMVKINNKEISKLSEFVGILQTVIFSPEDLNIIKGSPGVRRDFIDLELIKINKKYLAAMNKYRRVLKQRNALLKTMNLNSDFTILNILSDELYKIAVDLIDIKEEFISRLNIKFINVFKKFSNNKVSLNYLPSVTKEEFMNHLTKNQKQDILYKTTSVGPHRDDLALYFNNNPAKQASQGEIRLMVVSLKLALVKLIKELTNSNVVLLLDDVLSEFDRNIQNNFLNELPKDMQIIMNSAINIKSDNIEVIDLEGVKNGR